MATLWVPNVRSVKLAPRVKAFRSWQFSRADLKSFWNFARESQAAGRPKVAGRPGDSAIPDISIKKLSLSFLTDGKRTQTSRLFLSQRAFVVHPELLI